MGLILILIVVAVGILVIYRSLASELPQAILDEAMANSTINSDGTSTIAVPSLGYKKTFNQADTIRAGVDMDYYNKLLAQVVEELKVLYSQKHPSQPPNVTIVPNNPATPNSPSPTPPTSPTPPSTQPAPSQPSQDPSPSSPAPDPSSSPNQPSATPSDNTTDNQDKITETTHDVQGNYRDSGDSDMPTYSRSAAFTLTPIANISQADTIGIYIDRQLVKAIKPATKGFNIDTSMLKNGQHRLDVVVYDKSDKILAQYALVFKSENNLNFFERTMRTISSPFMRLFGL